MKKTVRWVCGECGSNNMSHESAFFQCTVCGKIRTNEPLIDVNTKKVIDASIDYKIKITPDNFVEFLNFSIQKYFARHVRKLLLGAVIFVLIVESIFVYNSTDMLDIFCDNIQHICYDANLERFSDMFSHLENVLYLKRHFKDSFNYYLSDNSDPDMAFQYDFSEVSSTSIGSFDMDFDEDGVEETLKISVVSIEEESGFSKATLCLSMYENENGQSTLAAERILTKDEIYLPSSTISSDSKFNVFVDCFTYGENNVNIAVETADYASLFADARSSSFVAYSYNGKKFKVETNATVVSVGFDDEDEPSFTTPLSESGIALDWGKYVAQDTFISDYVKNYTCLFYMKYASSCSCDEFQKWSENRDVRLKYASGTIFTEGVGERIQRNAARIIGDKIETKGIAFLKNNESISHNVSTNGANEIARANFMFDRCKKIYSNIVDNCRLFCDLVTDKIQKWRFGKE